MSEPSLNQLMFFQQLLNGLSIGCTYALIALGYNLMFGVLKIVNLAYGEIFMAGSFVALFALSFIPGHPAWVIVAAISGSIIVGLLVHFLAVKPLGNVSSLDSPRHLAVLITTSGCSLVLQNLALAIFGAYPQRFPRLIPEWHVTLASTSVDMVIFLNLFVSLLTMGALSFFLNRTIAGLRIRALSENRELALCSGIRTSADEVIWS